MLPGATCIVCISIVRIVHVRSTFWGRCVPALSDLLGSICSCLKRPFRADVSLPGVCCMRMRWLWHLLLSTPLDLPKNPRGLPRDNSRCQQPSSLPSSGAGLSLRPCLTCALCAWCVTFPAYERCEPLLLSLPDMSIVRVVCHTSLQVWQQVSFACVTSGLFCICDNRSLLHV